MTVLLLIMFVFTISLNDLMIIIKILITMDNVVFTKLLYFYTCHMFVSAVITFRVGLGHRRR